MFFLSIIKWQRIKLMKFNEAKGEILEIFIYKQY